MKKLMMLLLAMAMMVAFIGCSKSNEEESKSEKVVEEKQEEVNEEKDPETKEAEPEKTEPVELKVVAPAGSPVISLAGLIASDGQLSDQVKAIYEPLTSIDVLKSKIISNEADIAIVPTNLAAVLYNKGAGYQIIGTSVWGNLYLVSSTEIKDVAELKGKKIHAFGQGLTPDILMTYLLEQKGVKKEDLDIEFVANATEIAPLFITGKAEIALIPEPMLSAVKMKKEQVYSVMDLQEEWKALKGFNYPQASVIAKAELVENHKEALATFIDAYKNSVVELNSNPEKAGELAEKLEMGYKKPIIAKALPGCHLDVVTATDAKESIMDYLKVLEQVNVKTLGGKLPDEGIIGE